MNELHSAGLKQGLIVVSNWIRDVRAVYPGPNPALDALHRLVRENLDACGAEIDARPTGGTLSLTVELSAVLKNWEWMADQSDQPRIERVLEAGEMLVERVRELEALERELNAPMPGQFTLRQFAQAVLALPRRAPTILRALPSERSAIPTVRRSWCGADDDPFPDVPFRDEGTP